MILSVNSDAFIRYKNTQQSIKNKCFNMKNVISHNIPYPIIINYHTLKTSNELNRIAPKYRPKLFVRISPHYGFEMGYCKGKFNNHKVIIFLCENCIASDNNWARFKCGTYDDATVVNHLRTVFIRNNNNKESINKKYHIILAKDTLNIYNMTNSHGYNVNWRLYRQKDRIRIIRTLKEIHTDKHVLSNILQLSNHYPERYCMDMWLEWLYLAMLAEFFPKHPHPYDVYPTATGKYVKALGLYQSLYKLDMTPYDVGNFSKHKRASYLNNLTKKYLKYWNNSVNKYI